MQTKLPDGSVMISGYVPRDAEYRRVGDKDSSLTHFSVKIGEKPSANVDERGAVSYTHLDVYKRQAPEISSRRYSALMSAGIRSGRMGESFSACSTSPEKVRAETPAVSG